MRSLKKRFPLVEPKERSIFQFVQSGLACLGLFGLVFIFVLFVNTQAREASYAFFTEWAVADSQTSTPIENTQISEEAAQTDNKNTSDVSEEQQASADPAANITLADLSPVQVKVAKWLSRRYSVAVDPIVPLVAEAWNLGPKMNVKPTLLLAVAAIESRFNPIAQSHFGAQGLMQVRTKVHKERYDEHGGLDAVFDPVVNMRVGASILQEYIRRFGGIEKGLKAYVGAAFSGNHNGYADKVFGVQNRLNAVAGIKDKPVKAAPKSAPKAK